MHGSPMRRKTAEKADRIRRLGRMTGRLFEIIVLSVNGLPRVFREGTISIVPEIPQTTGREPLLRN